MKKSLVYLLIATSFLGVGCSEDFLNPVRDTRVLTGEEVAAAAELNPGIVQGGLDGLYNFVIEPGGVVGTGRHYDLGQKGVDIWLDMLSSDMALSSNSYGWYQNVANLISPVDFTRQENTIIWTYYYKVISTSNEIINQLGGNDAVPASTETRHIYAQAKALRAYAYFYLAQIFQRTNDLSQPILPYYVGDENDNLAKVPASQIYALIESDLLQSIDLLSDYTRPTKDKIDPWVAKGLLAYTYAAQGNYAQAKVTSEDIINNSGYTLTTRGQLAFPGAGSGFNDVNTPSWMWGFDLTEELGHQLVDWWGQIDYFTYSYAWAGDRKSIDTGLLAAIPTGDIRRTQFGTSGTTNRMPINKFFDPARVAGQQYIITTDLIFMRFDEFYLLSAEASAKTGDEATAKNRLKDLMTIRFAGGAAAADAYVDPLSGQALKDAIYLNTRIEMWGEGKSYLAMKRNEATVTRGTNHVFRSGQSFAFDSDEMSFQIPQSEILNNPAITGQN
ncbi:RagB/SusD family nutrient uptake outer membrane protein [Flavobacterium sp. AS60]|uniref:RagB/SusD family nutrient uptake outer membrane protein n=1 Tax=Flavobacterium anseongense TaxID=2910677 RepID=UPI001F2471F1|nr:RagB/SusD family nutrient uptake outer membrane protein [Flavobacterium sp. AS60]MCF6128227.1 RagB/SusD family nutrient uptake outer membrane protein [Flavobacterium sp. AS60]